MEGSSLSDLDSEDELQIDETPPPRRKTAGKKKKLSSKYLTEGSVPHFYVSFLNLMIFFLQVELLLLKFALQLFPENCPEPNPALTQIASGSLER